MWSRNKLFRYRCQPPWSRAVYLTSSSLNGTAGKSSCVTNSYTRAMLSKEAVKGSWHLFAVGITTRNVVCHCICPSAGCQSRGSLHLTICHCWKARWGNIQYELGFTPLSDTPHGVKAQHSKDREHTWLISSCSRNTRACAYESKSSVGGRASMRVECRNNLTLNICMKCS